MALLRHFGLESLTQEHLVDGVHDPGNLHSIEDFIHTHFDNLELWFEGTNEVRYS